MESKLVIPTGRWGSAVGVRIPYPWAIKYSLDYGPIKLVAHRALKPHWRKFVMKKIAEGLSTDEIIKRLFKKDEWVMAELSTGYKAGPLSVKKAVDMPVVYERWLQVYSDERSYDTSPQQQLERVLVKAIEKDKDYKGVRVEDAIDYARSFGVKKFNDAVDAVYMMMQEASA